MYVCSCLCVCVCMRQLDGRGNPSSSYTMASEIACQTPIHDLFNNKPIHLELAINSHYMMSVSDTLIIIYYSILMNNSSAGSVM